MYCRSPLKNLKWASTTSYSNLRASFMNFRKSKGKEKTSEEILNQVNNCKPEELESLLHQIQDKLENSTDKDWDLLWQKP